MIALNEVPRPAYYCPLIDGFDDRKAWYILRKEIKEFI